MVPSNALSKTSTSGPKTNTKSKGVIYLCVNGVKYKYQIGSGCINKPSKPEVTPDDNQNNSGNNSGSTEKPGDNNQNNSGNNSGSTEKPEDNNQNNSGNNSGSTEKPEDNNQNNSGNNSESTEKPEDNNQPSGNFASYQQEVVNLVNVERSKQGLKPLTLNAKLSNVATTKSQDMINKNYFDHTSPTYGSPFDMMKQFGISYRTAGENIAMGQRTPSEVVNAWMNSEGHRKNILSANFTEIGVGVAKNSNGSIYWTQMFIGN
ncbi:sporulation protein [Romboutsia weinsteinii]|uniref:Sporulation protein n=2 Tax=Romboutsia weinsteinii TaxID=2020949 RepID=A0A371J3H7_9FIRM|nr:sporulation protein [Romboutsia weinsteinii]